MKSKHKMLLLIFVALCIAGGYSYNKKVDAETKQLELKQAKDIKEQESKEKIELERERTKQIELMLQKNTQAKQVNA